MSAVLVSSVQQGGSVYACGPFSDSFPYRFSRSTECPVLCSRPLSVICWTFNIYWCVYGKLLIESSYRSSSLVTISLFLKSVSFLLCDPVHFVSYVNSQTPRARDACRACLCLTSCGSLWVCLCCCRRHCCFLTVT